jgi:hypothetical protein
MPILFGIPDGQNVALSFFQHNLRHGLWIVPPVVAHYATRPFYCRHCIGVHRSPKSRQV